MVAKSGSTMATRTERHEKNIMVAGKVIQRWATFESENKITMGGCGPASLEDVEEGACLSKTDL